MLGGSGRNAGILAKITLREVANALPRMLQMTTQGFAEKSVFVCYAIRDQEPHRWLDRLKVQLKPLMQRYEFDVWDDGQIKPGEKWRPKIEASLGHAKAAVLLVGPAFLASKFITEIELPQLLQRAQRDRIPLLILITQHCNFADSVLAEFQAFRDEHRPLEPLEALAPSDQNRILQAFSVAIKSAVEEALPDREEQEACHSVPSKPTNVVGRDRELRDLSAALLAEDKPVVLASGFGGVGKSTVAKLIAWHFLDRQHPFKFIPWVDVRQYSEDENGEPITFGFVLNSIARAASPESEIIAIGDLDVKAARVRELLSSTDSLLILDNYESLLANAEEERKVARFIERLPIGTTGDHHNPLIRVLITTRMLSPALATLHSYNERLKQLPFEDSLKMMKSRPDAPTLTRRQWKRVWEILQGLPKYMQIAVPQLQGEAFADWEEKVTKITWRPDKPDDFFFDLFDFSWRNPTIISDDLKHVLLAMPHFVGHAPPEELYRTSGLERDRFVHTLSGAYISPYVEVSRKRGGAEYYTLHSLMHSYCRAALTSDEFRKFRQESSIRFVDCYSDFAKNANVNNALHLLDDESGNVLAAVRGARRLEMWETLIDFRQNTAEFYRHRGKWDEYKEVVELASAGCRHLGNEELLAKCLVYDLAWYYSRLEDVPMSRKLIEEGYSLFQELDNGPGIAQAERHLGKTALLDGLDDLYRPLEGAESHFRRAEEHYRRSLEKREQLQREGEDQSLAIADMKLDFGRLYWLQGMWLQKKRAYNEARQKYEEADRVSEEARLEYEQMSVGEGITKARVAKAWGNRGNAAKELASCLAETDQWAGAKACAELGVEYYGRNLLIGEEISKKDEIAHALAGLAELRVLMTKWPNNVVQTDTKRALLRAARKEAKRSHRLYEELAGPGSQLRTDEGNRGKKTRDELRTQDLIDEIERLRDLEAQRDSSKFAEELHPRDARHPDPTGVRGGIVRVEMDSERSDFDLRAQRSFVEELASLLGTSRQRIVVEQLEDGSIVVVLRFEDDDALVRFMNMRAGGKEDLRRFCQDWRVSGIQFETHRHDGPDTVDRLPSATATGFETKGGVQMSKKHAFLSYCRDNKADVAQLREYLMTAGETVWWDQEILPGEDWKFSIRKAMKDSYAVVVCLSKELSARVESGVYPELRDAIEAFRKHPPGSIYLIPVRMSDCEIPGIEIDDVRTLDRLQHVDLFPPSDAQRGMNRLIEALRAAPGHP